MGSRLVDPATVAQLHHRRARTWPLWLLVLVLAGGLVATVVLAGDTTTVGEWRDDLVTAVRDLVGGS